LATDGGGIEMLAGSESVSVMLGSAYRPFLVEIEEELDADDRLCRAELRVFNLGSATEKPGLGSGLC
jgi:hypothetical protein